MDPVIQVYISGLKDDTVGPAIKKITLSGVCQAVIMHWEQHQGQHLQHNNSANKISPVKCKGQDPTFRQQQRPQGQ